MTDVKGAEDTDTFQNFETVTLSFTYYNVKQGKQGRNLDFYWQKVCIMAEGRPPSLKDILNCLPTGSMSFRQAWGKEEMTGQATYFESQMTDQYEGVVHVFAALVCLVRYKIINY